MDDGVGVVAPINIVQKILDSERRTSFRLVEQQNFRDRASKRSLREFKAGNDPSREGIIKMIKEILRRIISVCRNEDVV